MTLVPEIVDMEMPVEGVFHNLVIAQIRKDYPGQAQKVMNAMWGAGQMMFNKILVVVDQPADIHDYLSLARYALGNLNPSTDIYFSQGPMDVLDHSCSRPGFGGKMCLDGTAKYPEEQFSDADPAGTIEVPDAALLMERFPEITAVNTGLVALGTPCLLVAVQKNRPNHIRELHEGLCRSPGYSSVKLTLFVDSQVDVLDVADLLWRFCNNLDPRRDSMLCGRQMGLDGTRKTRQWDDFQREWPNIILSDAATIRRVDEKWPTLGLCPFIPSPSLKYQDQLYGPGAAAE
jgi:4-hydroxy-3-polyprenylbenzoate decarboxylase